MNKIAVAVACFALVGGAFYFYVGAHDSSAPQQSREESHSLVSQVSSSVGRALYSPAPQHALKQAASFSSAPDEGFTPEMQQQNLENIVEDKYAILFSMLQMSGQTQQALRAQLFMREQILNDPFYDARSNEAEIAANLNKREQDVAEIDRSIEALLSEDDAKKYRLLKDSTYEQAQMNSFYELANAEHNLPVESKHKLLLAKLEQKQSVTILIDGVDAIKNAAPGTRPYLIEKMHQALVNEKETYLRNARNLLSAEQFSVLQDYEQQLFDERWQDINAGFVAE